MTRLSAHGAPQSGDRPRASTESRGSLTEEELLWSMRPQRIEPCVCGGIVAARPGDWSDIHRAIRQHQRTPRHQDWRSRTWDNTHVGSSDQSNSIARGARVSATTRGAGVVRVIEVVAR